jgi:cysteinyl-tRNA synthetase
MKLTNTLTRKKEEFRPLKDGVVKLYTCGPTVYDYAHIGNLRNAIFNDTLKRTLKLSYKVHHVMNITDVGHLVSDADDGEDKLETGAKREGKTVWEVAELYTKAYFDDIKKVNIQPAETIAKATDHIKEQIELATQLLDKGFAYQTEQAIYFDVTKLQDYGKLTGQTLADKEVGVRQTVVTDDDKHHPQDFALWFFTVGHFAHHTMHWPSPWGEGFPGWHLECSAIIKATLGDTIDIHTGAIDLIGTHHTNEIAQSEAAHNKPLANYWVHNEYLMVEGKKMSKSLGNLYRVEDLEKKGFSPLAFRLLVLQSNYRSQQNFTWEALEAAQNFLLDLYAWADRLHQSTPGNPNPDFDVRLQGTNERFEAALNDDLNTPQALAALSELVNWMEKAPLPAKDQEGFAQFLEQVDSVLGLELVGRDDISSKAKQLIAEREEARDSKDFTRADRLRKELLDQNIEIDDTTFGPRWRKTTL